MKYSIQDSEATDLQKMIEVSLDADETAKRAEEIYAFLTVQAGVDHIAAQSAEPLEKRFGADLNERVAQCIANQLVDEIIQKENLPAALEPIVQFASPVEEGTAFEGSVLLYLKPEVELSSYGPVELNIPPFEVTDEQVRKNMDAVVEKHAKYIDDEEPHPVSDEDVAVITLTTAKYGMPVQNLNVEELYYRIDGGEFPEPINDELRGMMPGEKKEFSFNITSKNFLGLDVEETMDSTLEVHKIVHKDMPELTDEWVKGHIPGADSVATFEQLIRENVVMRARADYDKLKAEAALTALASRLPELELPDVYIDYARAGLLQNFSAALARQGLSQEEFYTAQGITSTQFMIQMTNRAKDVMRQGLALDALAKHDHLDITPQDLQYSLISMSPNDPEEAERMLKMNGRLYQLDEMALRAKARAKLMDETIIASDSSE